MYLLSISNRLTVRILRFKLGPCLLLRWFIPAFRSHERPWEFNFYHPNAIRSNQKDRNRLLQHTVSSIDNHNHAATLQYTGGSWLMRIWLMMISLLRNIKRFLRYLACATCYLEEVLPLLNCLIGIQYPCPWTTEPWTKQWFMPCLILIGFSQLNVYFW